VPPAFPWVTTTAVNQPAPFDEGEYVRQPARKASSWGRSLPHNKGPPGTSSGVRRGGDGRVQGVGGEPPRRPFPEWPTIERPFSL